MALTLKRDNKGNVVCNEAGLPLWVAEDGREIAYDVNELVGKVSVMSGEKAAQDKALAALNAKLDSFNGLEPEKVREALRKTATLPETGMGNEPSAEARMRMEREYGSRLAEVEKARAEEANKHQAELTAQEERIRALMVKSAFESSVFLREKTVLPPDMAWQCFGNLFEVREEEGQLRVVALLDGKPLFSRHTPGALAGTEEALEAIINAYPMKEHILRSTASGSGSKPSEKQIARGNGKKLDRAAFDRLSATDKAAFMRDGGNLMD